MSTAVPQPGEASQDPAATGSSAPLQDADRLAAETLFGDRLPVAEAYVEHLATSGIERGLIGPREVPRLWERHVLNCAAPAPLLVDGTTVADVGSGAGLPGLCLAIARPGVEFLLIEPLERRCVWLQEVIDDLALENVTILRGRSEQFFGKVTADVVTARAVSAMTNLAGMTLPLLSGNGVLLALKGRSAAEEIAKAAKKISSLGGRDPRVFTVGDDVLAEPTTLVRVDVGSVEGVLREDVHTGSVEADPTR
ncbi:16S rRNA (guanine(527)-N(7))-methyltransferase RsmG [Falsarthrobacter nasiphocae]|uniref:Ribosomal RNA small subunit methyltransferase G n=1 Tax=Falsarthrobacter nasiphocae TaxID=189863 RepID=A0AAE3YET3_9MICC|nr:16S rRNA (guanine(527)-N(7))-methyltransferase RsmG [Falsarthrobacter nasiphocae]MDR6892079.1 16S rRNA (guanine527-N7)-methyltransferase [Falsarthrobacter nasiphocae]